MISLHQQTIVVVLGRNYMSLLSMARSAGQAGYPVYILKTVRRVPGRFSPQRLSPDTRSKYVKACYYVRQNDDAALIEALQQHFSAFSQVILLPTDDRVAEAVDQGRERLGPAFLAPFVRGNGSLVHLMDKACQKELARAAGLPVAKGWTVEVKNGSYHLPEGIEYPVFTKPQISFAGNKRFMKKCSSEQELRAVLQEVADQCDCPMLLEQFVAIEKEYGVLGCCLPDRVLLPCLVDKIEIGSGTHKGVTMIGEVSALQKVQPQVYEKLQAMLQVSGFVGLVDIDLYESGGQIWFNELNLRLGAFGFAAMCAGINMPRLLIAALLQQPLPPACEQMQQSICCLSEKVALEDYAGRFCSRRTYRRRFTQAEYGLIRWPQDPMPWRYFKLEEMKQTLKRLLKKG